MQQSQVVQTLVSNICITSLPFSVQDIQAEIDAHNDIFKSIDGNRQKMVKALGNSEEATMLQHRLDDMNQRWNDLKAKSVSIRSVTSVAKITGGRIFMIFAYQEENKRPYQCPVPLSAVPICKFAYHILNLIMLTMLPVPANC